VKARIDSRLRHCCAFVTRLAVHARLVLAIVLALAVMPSVGERLRAEDAEIIDRVLAVVAGDVIMLSDVAAARDLGLVPADPGPDPVRSVLSRLIDRSLILAEVDRYAPPEPSQQAITEALRAVQSRFPSQSAFDAALARVGLDEKHLSETLRQNLRMRTYLDQRFTADTPERRQTLIDEWVAGLRRRAQIIDLYAASP
jgi:hypothetical protein